MSSAGGNDVSLSIGADTSGFTQGINLAAQSTTNFAQAVASAADLSTSSLSSMTAALNALTAQAKYLDQATQVLGADTAQQNLAWLAGQTGAKNYTDALTYLNAQLGFLKTQQDAFPEQTQNVGSAIKNNLIGGFTGLAFSVNQVVGFLGNMKDVAGGVVDAVMKIPNAVASIPMNFLSSQLGVPTDPMQAVNAGLDESWQLNVNTQKNLGAWRYIYGSGGTEKNNQVDPKVAQLMQWTSTESFNLPYTRQDLINAITQLGRMGMSSEQVQNAIPALADLGVLNPNRDLTQAAMAVQGASMGYARMLRYDYGINPADLAQYGLSITGIDHINNPDQLLPALEKYEQARGLTGSAQYAATSTWWGSWSSFQDRIQNFLLQAGGTDLSGNVQKGSFFGNMQSELEGVMHWMDDPNHLATIQHWADVISNGLGGAVKSTTSAIQGFFSGLQSSGAGNTILDGLTHFGDWLNAPSTQAAFANVGAEVGKVVTPVAQTVAAGGQGFLQGLGDSGVAQSLKSAADNFKAAFSDPKTKQDAIDFGSALGGIVGWLGKLAAFDFRVLTDEFKAMGDVFGSVGSLWNDVYNGNFGNVPNDLGALKDSVGSFIGASWNDALDALGIGSSPTPGTTANGTENTLPGNPTGKSGAPYGVGALPPNYTPTGTAASLSAVSKQANTDAQAYVTAFHQQMANSSVGVTIAQALTTNIATGLNSQSNTFADALNTYVTAKVQQVVAAAMQGMAVSTNAAARVPGGKTSPYAPGVA